MRPTIGSITPRAAKAQIALLFSSSFPNRAPFQSVCSRPVFASMSLMVLKSAEQETLAWSSEAARSALELQDLAHVRAQRSCKGWDRALLR